MLLTVRLEGLKARGQDRITMSGWPSPRPSSNIMSRRATVLLIARLWDDGIIDPVDTRKRWLWPFGGGECAVGETTYGGFGL